MKRHWTGVAILGCLLGLAPGGPAFAQQFPWEPVKPPVYSPPPSEPAPQPPKVEAPTHVVAGHKSSYGYVAPYESDGPVSPPLAPGEKSNGWVPGYHDSKGGWVPGHPQ